MKFWGFRQRYRYIKRYREIAEIFIRHGFGFLVERFDLHQFLPYKRKFRHLSDESDQVNIPRRLRSVLEDLGPTFIKLGQLLSIRPDLLPEEYIEELENLQDKVPSFSFKEVKERVEKDLKAPLETFFKEFEEEPLAAASIGQVHRAITTKGQRVVVKIQRPKVKEVIDMDLAIMQNLAHMVRERFFVNPLYDPEEIVHEFASSIKQELDYRNEGRNTQRFQKNFRDDSKIKIPSVYWDLTTNKILTMEEIVGIKILDIKRVKEAGHDCTRLARIGAEAFMKQVLFDGFFHGDPHPGNIFVTGNGNLGMVDFGVTGRVSEGDLEIFASVFIGIIRRDAKSVARALFEIGEFGETINQRSFHKDLEELIDDYYGVSLKDIRVGELLMKIFTLAKKYQIKLPGDLIVLARALMTMEGGGKRLDPDFDVFQVAEPFAQELIRRRMLPQNVLERLVDDLSDVASVLRTLPYDIQHLIKLMVRNKLSVEFRHTNLEGFISRLDIISNRISISLIISALLVASSLIIDSELGPMVSGLPLLGITGYILAGFLGIWLVLSILRSGRF